MIVVLDNASISKTVPLLLNKQTIDSSDALKNIIIKNVKSTLDNFFNEFIFSDIDNRIAPILDAANIDYSNSEVIILLIKDILITNALDKKKALLNDTDFLHFVSTNELNNIKGAITQYFFKHDKALEIAISEPNSNASLKNIIFINFNIEFDYTYENKVKPLFKLYLMKAIERLLTANYINTLDFIKGKNNSLEDTVEQYENSILKLLAV